MNVPEMQRLIDHFKGLPPIPVGVWRVDSEYPPSRVMAPVFQELSCGTVGCICGEWALMNGKSLQYLRGITIFRDFSEALALKVEAVNCLIEANEWLDGFYAKYLDLPNDDLNAERALMIEYLEWIAADPERFSKAVEAAQAVSA